MTDQADTPDPIGEWLAAGDKATPGPWFRDYGDVVLASDDPRDYFEDEPRNARVVRAAEHRELRDEQGITDAEFIAASRNVVPAVRALVAELAAARDREAAVRAETHLDDDLPILAPDGMTDQWVEGWDYAIDEMWRRVRAALSQSEPTAGGA